VVFAGDKQAAEMLRHAGFVNVETSVEAARTVLDDAHQYEEFVRNIIMRAHLRQIPSEELRRKFMAELTEQAATDPHLLAGLLAVNLSGTVMGMS